LSKNQRKDSFPERILKFAKKRKYKGSQEEKGFKKTKISSK